MPILEKLFGSKYDKKLPYTYHAKKTIASGIERDWFGDVFCQLCKHLRQDGESPDDIAIYECFSNKEVVMPKAAYMNSDGDWLLGADLCAAHTRYGRPGSLDGCGFVDRKSGKITS